MIIEIFGPPGAGKTTFAQALKARMRERGHLMELRLSQRPTENVYGRAPIGSYQNVMIQRLTRPLLETLTIARQPFANSRDLKTAIHLVRLLAPTSTLSSIKEMQYLFRLSHWWHDKSRTAPVTLFDQGFVQAVCTLALRAGATNDKLIGDALDYAPKSDLLIRLDAPLELLEARLHDRERLQSAIERRLEPDLRLGLAFIPMIDRVQSLLLQRGRYMLSGSSVDRRALDKSVKVIEKEVTKMLQNRTQVSLVKTLATTAVSSYGKQ